MKVDLVGPDSPRWSGFLDQVPHDFHHLPGYAELEAGRLGGRATALIVEDGEAGLLLPLIVRPIDGAVMDAMSPYGYPGPLVLGADPTTFIGRALDAALPCLRSTGLVSLFVRSHPILNATTFSGPGVIVHHGDTVAVDLSLSAQERRAATRRNHLDGIRNATLAGLRASWDEPFAQFRTFQELYRCQMERVSAGPEYFLDAAYFDGLRKLLGDRLRLCVVECDGTIAAAVLVVETGAIVEYHLGGIAEAYVRAGPTKLVIQFAQDWGASRGDRWLHLGGGVGASYDSVFHFKAGFSQLRFPFMTMRIVLDRPRYDALARGWDPDWAGDDSSFFPAYRRPIRALTSVPSGD